MNMERSNESGLFGLLAMKTNDGFRAWYRPTLEFEIVSELPSEQQKVFLGHLKDVYNIARRYGIERALEYDWKTFMAQWNEACRYADRHPLSGTKFLT